MTKLESLKQDFQNACSRLEEILKEPKSDIVRDSAIKRFELVFDLSWKLIKAHLEEQGVTCASPMSCFKEAYRNKLIEYEDVWVDMVKTRNQTVHTYDENVAEEVYAKLPQALGAFEKLKGAFV